MTRSAWHSYAELGCNASAAFAFSFAGVAIVERLRLGDFGQTVFWPVYAALIYWLVLREIHFKRPKAEAPELASVRVRFALSDYKFGTNSERERIQCFTGKLVVA